MDGDRPMADGRDLLESELQELIRDALIYGWCKGSDDDMEFEVAPYHERIHELLISYFDGETGDVGTQDEASETRAVGNGIRPESHMRGLGFKPTVFDDITSEFTKKLSFRFPNYGLVKPVGYCKLEKMPDGSIRAIIKYY